MGRGSLELTKYGFDLRNHYFAHVITTRSVTWKPVARGLASIPGPGPVVSIMAVAYG